MYDFVSLGKVFWDGFERYMERSNDRKAYTISQMMGFMEKNPFDDDESVQHYFEGYIKNLVKMRAYALIVHFSASLFECQNEIDFEKYGCIIETVQIDGKITLRELCNTVFRKAYYMDLYDDYFTPDISIEGYPISSINEALKEVEIELYGAVGEGVGLIDSLVDKLNASASSKYTPVLGGLLAATIVKEVEDDDEVLYIYERYIFPQINSIAWDDVNAYMYADIVVFYLNLFRNIVIRHGSIAFSDGRISNFRNQVLGIDNDDTIFSSGNNIFGGRNELVCNLLETVTNESLFKCIKEPKLTLKRSKLFTITIYALYCAGRHEEAAELYIESFYKLDIYEKESRALRLISYRLAIQSEDIEHVMIIYGYIRGEHDKYVANEAVYSSYFKDIVEILDDIRECVRKSGGIIRSTKQSYYDYLYGSDTLSIHTVMKESKDLIKAGELFVSDNNRNILKSAIRTVHAFCQYPGYISLGLLNVDCIGQDDKISFMLPTDILVRARRLLNRFDEYEAFLDKREQSMGDTSAVLLIIQNHIDDLRCRTLLSTIDEIVQLKSSIDDEGELFNILDICLDRLQKMLLVSDYGREAIEKRIQEMQSQFFSRNQIQHRYDLLMKLPPKEQLEVVNYLVTSELVYDMLKNRNDKEKLDFSSVIIPLSKALETVLYSQVYRRMKLDNNKKISSREDANRYFEKYESINDGYIGHRHKKKLELGPLIHLLLDYNNINIKENRIQLDYKKQQSLYILWDGDSILDISKLKELKNEDILVKNNNCIHFCDGDIYNRHIFAYGLMYVKDNYRNKAGHKDHVSLTTAEECRELLIRSHDLLWMLLYILR